MRIIEAAMVFCLLTLLCMVAAADDVDLTGTWESKYKIGLIEEVMTAEIQQIDDRLVGSFQVKSFTGSERSGIIFGTVEGDKVKVNFLSVREPKGGDPLVTLTFIDGRMTDDNTLNGTYYVNDSEQKSSSGSYEATRR